LLLPNILERYFIAHHCTEIEKNDDFMKVQLTEELDKTLMNRPFYWHYVRSTGVKGKPMTLTLITNHRSQEKGELIHFGSPRLQQIFSNLRSNERFTRQFQHIEVEINTPLYPWLLVNFKLSFEGKQRREEIFSVGLHLISGAMKTNMMELLEPLHLSLSIGDLCHTVTPLIRLENGFARIEKLMQSYIDSLNHEWVDQSLQTMKEEQDLLGHFLEGEENKEIIKREMEAIRKRYEPKISMQIINAGIVHLQNNAI